jgi:hypothetical protein
MRERKKKCVFLYCCVWKKSWKFFSFFRGRHILSVKTREGLVPIQFFFSTTQQRLLYYSLLSFLFNKVNFLSSSSLHYFTFTYQGSNRKLSSKRERKKMKIFSFIFRVWGVGTLLHGGNTHTHTHPKKKKENFHDWIRYTRSETQVLREWGGCFLGESYVVKLERKKLKKIKRKWEEKRGNRLLLPFDEMKFPPSITHGNKTDIEIEGENFQIVSYDFLKLL